MRGLQREHTCRAWAGYLDGLRAGKGVVPIRWAG